MKKFAITSCVVVVALIISLWICIDALQQTKDELATAQAELEVRKEVWWKLVTLSTTYHDKLDLSIPNFNYDKGTERPMVVTGDGWRPETRYEFSSDGKSAKFFFLGKESGWSIKP